MAATFQSFHVSTRLVCVLEAWRSAWALEEPNSPLFSPCCPLEDATANIDDAKELMRLFVEESIHIPTHVDLYSLFFLLSQFNFTHHWHLWILPTLRRCDAQKSLIEGSQDWL
jgi:hypothetical protein